MGAINSRGDELARPARLTGRVKEGEVPERIPCLVVVPMGCEAPAAEGRSFESPFPSWDHNPRKLSQIHVVNTG